jgi:hypothetical protein
MRGVEGDDVAAEKLAASAFVGLAVDAHLAGPDESADAVSGLGEAVLDEFAGVVAGLGEAGQFEELAEPDHVVAGAGGAARGFCSGSGTEGRARDRLAAVH